MIYISWTSSKCHCSLSCSLCLYLFSSIQLVTLGIFVLSFHIFHLALTCPAPSSNTPSIIFPSLLSYLQLNPFRSHHWTSVVPFCLFFISRLLVDWLIHISADQAFLWGQKFVTFVPWCAHPLNSYLLGFESTAFLFNSTNFVGNQSDQHLFIYTTPAFACVRGIFCRYLQSPPAISFLFLGFPYAISAILIFGWPQESPAHWPSFADSQYHPSHDIGWVLGLVFQFFSICSQVLIPSFYIISQPISTSNLFLTHFKPIIYSFPLRLSFHWLFFHNNLFLLIFDAQGWLV